MPAVHEFPAPPRPSGSKMNGHGSSTQVQPSNGYAHADEEDTPGYASTSRRSSGSMRIDEDSDDEEEDRVTVHLEVQQKTSSYLPIHTIKRNLVSYIQSEMTNLRVGTELEGWADVEILNAHVEKIWVSESSGEGNYVVLEEADLHVHIYKPSMTSRLEEFAATTEDDDEGDQVPAASIRDLPSQELDGLWENLIYADDLKGRLLKYIYSTTSFSDAEVDANVVSWNRMVLLHGPPGTGKTSLCRALAHKLSIRLSDRYSYGRIIEINSHSLFSKWFSESGKLVQKLFSKVNEMVDDERAFIVVLIDEVESLTAARAGAMSGNEPSDAVRVVNALLTQLDKLKSRKNVLVVTTSNIAGAIDSAFVDRADIKEYVGLPPPQAVYWILSGCMNELTIKGMLRPEPTLSWHAIELKRKQGEHERTGQNASNSLRLANLAYKCHEYKLAGRFLRRLPVLAHARYMGVQRPGEVRPRSFRKWLDALEKVVEDEKSSRDLIALADGQRGTARDHKDVASRVQGAE